MTFEPIASPSTQDPGDLVAKLGVNLVDSGAIDRRTLDRARRVATETGGQLDQVLTQLGLVSDRGLAEALAQPYDHHRAEEAANAPGAPLLKEKQCEQHHDCQRQDEAVQRRRRNANSLTALSTEIAGVITITRVFRPDWVDWRHDVDPAAARGFVLAG